MRTSSARRLLTAGPLTMQLENGGLRYVRLGDREVWRSIYVAVRDPKWRTIPALLSEVHIQSDADSFAVSFQADHREGSLHFHWSGRIDGDARGTVTLSMDGEVKSTFKRARIGICVLHPIEECAGVACEVETVAGARVAGTFPKLVSPHQPFIDIRTFSHEVRPGLRASVRFEGDTFEMEDQRNWADASYKTYSTPLAIPYPVEVAAGTRIRQAATMSLTGQVPGKLAAREPDIVDFAIDPGKRAPLLRIGTALPPGFETLGAKARVRVSSLSLSYLRVDVDTAPGPEDDGWRASFERAVAESREVGLPLEVALCLSESPTEELRAFADRLRALGPKLVAVAIVPRVGAFTSAVMARQAREIIGAVVPAVPIAGGSNLHFTEVNRNRGVVAGLDEICFPSNPQVHMPDDLSIVENLGALASIADTARSFAGGRPLVLSPVTLKPQPRPTPPVSTARDVLVVPPSFLPDHVDRRQASLAIAGWTAAHLGQVARAGFARATYFQAAGWLGLMDDEEGASLPPDWSVGRGSVFPLFHALADVGELAGGEVLGTTSRWPLGVDGLALRKGGAMRVMLANLRSGAEKVRLTRLPRGAEPVRIRRLTASGVLAAMQKPETFRAGSGEILGGDVVELSPHELATIDITGLPVL